MLNNLTTKQILIKDKDGKFKIARVESDNDNEQGSAKPVRTTFDAQIVDSGVVFGGVGSVVSRASEDYDTNKAQIKSTASKVQTEADSRQIKDHKAPASFYFSVDDEEDVKRFKDRKSQLSQQQLSNIIRAYAQAVMDKSMLGGLGLGLERRLLRVVESRLRDIRDLIETKEVLQRSVDLGGIGLDSGQVNNLIRIIEQERAGIEELVSKARDFKESEVNLMQSVARPGNRNERMYSDISLRKDYASDQKEETDTRDEELEIKEKDAGVPDSAKQVEPEINRANKQAAKQLRKKAAPEIENSKMNRRVMGPIDELGQITVEEFKKLGASLEESVEKIVKKLEVLEEESVNERSKGLAAWRRSPVYKTYLDIGQRSIEAQKSVEQYVRGLADKDRVMSFEEFEAIADLNKKLSF